MRGRTASSVFSLNRPLLALIPFALILLIGVLTTLALVMALPASLALPVFAIQAAMLMAGLAMLGLTARRFYEDARLEQQSVQAIFGNYQLRLQQLLDRCETDGRLITALQASGRADRTLSETRENALRSELDRVDRALSALSDGRLKVRLKPGSQVSETFNSFSDQLRDLNSVLEQLEARLDCEVADRLYDRPHNILHALDGVSENSGEAESVLSDRTHPEADDSLGAALAEDAATLSFALEEVSGAELSSNPETETPAPARTPELDHLSSERQAAAG